MITRDDIIIMEYSQDREVTAEYFTMQHWKAHSSKILHSEKTEKLNMLKKSYLTEFAFTEFLCGLFAEKLDESRYEWDISKADLGNRFLLIPVIKDLLNNSSCEKSIDLKTGNSLLNSSEAIFNHENGQEIRFVHSPLEFPKADIIVQSFITRDNSIILTGYELSGSIIEKTSGLYYSSGITDMRKMSDLIREFTR